MIFDYSKLSGKIKEVYGTQDKFAEALGMGRVSLSQRLNNKIEFSQEEILKAAELLAIKRKEITEYFFCEEVRETELNNLTKRNIREEREQNGI